MSMQTLHLSDQEASDFLHWVKNRDKWLLLMDSGVMDIREGSAEIHFDAKGNIGAIKAHVNVYKRDPNAALMLITVGPGVPEQLSPGRA